ncbi:PKD domain-containing protein [Owenweeksia hongkongensis]|uniref:PKD domain-containing protein n=1 Tax=Owenweeksia hongkongensis TaxID=253245 RepID=UPI003A8EDDB7
MKKLLTTVLLLGSLGMLSGQYNWTSNGRFYKVPDTTLSATFLNFQKDLNIGETVQYHWDFGDGTSVSYSGYQRVVNHIYSSQGWYTVKWTQTILDIRQDTLKNTVFIDSVSVGFINNVFGCDIDISVPDTINYFRTIHVEDESDTCQMPSRLAQELLFIYNDYGVNISYTSPRNQWIPYGGLGYWAEKAGQNRVLLIKRYVNDSTGKVLSENIGSKEFYIDPDIDAWSSIASIQSTTTKGKVSFTPSYGAPGFDPNIHKEHFLWSFGSGTSDTSKLPTHTFSNSGKYVIKLQYSIEDTASGKTVGLGLSYDTVVIAASNECHAGFEFEPHWANANKIEFENTSQNLYSAGTTEDFFEWDFGDGAMSTDIEPDHTYSKDGTYVVKLIHRVGDAQYNTVCSDTITKIITIGDGCHASYTIDTASSVNGNINVFNTSNYAKSGSTTVTYQWDFGDGITSNLAHPTHTYATNGPYQACLTINTVDSLNNTCTGYACHWLGLDSIGGLIFKSTGGFTLNVIDPNTVSVEENKVLDVNIYPNPASGFVNVEGLREDAEWTLFNLQGAMVSKGVLTSGDARINLEMLKSGLYVFNIQTKNSIKSMKLSIR